LLLLAESDERLVSNSHNHNTFGRNFFAVHIAHLNSSFCSIFIVFILLLFLFYCFHFVQPFVRIFRICWTRRRHLHPPHNSHKQTIYEAHTTLGLPHTNAHAASDHSIIQLQGGGPVDSVVAPFNSHSNRTAHQAQMAAQGGTPGSHMPGRPMPQGSSRGPGNYPTGWSQWAGNASGSALSGNGPGSGSNYPSQLQRYSTVPNSSYSARLVERTNHVRCIRRFIWHSLFILQSATDPSRWLPQHRSQRFWRWRWHYISSNPSPPSGSNNPSLQQQQQQT
jgi:hypothetical protein